MGKAKIIPFSTRTDKHQINITHKDIKPQNIIINPKTGQIKITDFSIASRLSSENLTLFGHEEEKTFFLNAFHSARFPHAWILGGNFGIGKATFAFHMARYVFSGRQDGNLQGSSAES